MIIVSSQILWSLLQKDGSFNVREQHVDDSNAVYNIDYTADRETDQTTHLSNTANNLLVSVAAQEIVNNINAVQTLGSLAIPTFIYTTPAQNVSSLRAAYLISSREQAIFMGDYLSSLTNIQLENAFNLTLSQVTTLRTNFLTPAATAATSIRNAVGT